MWHSAFEREKCSSPTEEESITDQLIRAKLCLFAPRKVKSSTPYLSQTELSIIRILKMSDTPLSLASHVSKYECSLCLKRYKRREHLLRHISSHTSQRPHQCNSCQGTFQRADVLKRHLKSCNGTSSRANTRRRACDRCVRCVRQKKACSSHQPCHGCVKRGAECWYSTDSGPVAMPEGEDIEKLTPRDPEGNPPVMGLTPPDLNTMMPWEFTVEKPQEYDRNPKDTSIDTDPTQYSSPSGKGLPELTPDTPGDVEPTTVNEIARESLRFLNKFTSNTGLVSSFDCGTHKQREQLSVELDRHISSQLQQRIMSLPALSMEVPPPLILEAISDTSSTDELPLDWFNDPLSLKTHEILLLIEEVVTIKPRNSSVSLDWSPTLKSACLRFFSPSNIRRFLGFYWAIWHPNVNFVHRPTFDSLSAKPTLVAAMALIGM